MQKIKSLITPLLTSLVMFTGFTPLAAQAENDQLRNDQLRVVSLMDAVCVSTGPGRWREISEDVSVNRQVYNSVLFMGPGTQYAGLACRIRAENPSPQDENFHTLRLHFGMRDNDWKSPSATIKIYLDGKAFSSQSVGPGEQASMSIPIPNVNNIAIETICNSDARYCDRVYFFQTALERFLPPEIDKTQTPPETSIPVVPPANQPQGNPPPPPKP